MRPYIEKQPPKFQPITAEELIQSVKNTFRGDPLIPSSKRGEMLNLAALSAAHTPLEKLPPLGEPVVESQIAVITPPQIEQLFKQSDELIQAGQLSQEAVSAALEIAQAGTLTADEAAISDPARLVDESGRKFLFPINREWRNLVGVFIALLFVLSMASAACAAGDSTALDAGRLTGQPTFFVDTPQPTPNAPQEGETPAPTEEAPQQTCVFDSARNLRTGPSATAPKTTLDGIGTTVAGKEYECLEVVENTDKSVWVKISEQPDVWAVIEHPTLELTGSITTGKPTQTDGVLAPIDAGKKITDTVTNISILTETQKVELLTDYNRIAASVGISQSVSITLSQEGKVLYLGADGKPIAIAEPTIDPMEGTLTAALLFVTDANGNKIGDVPVALKSGTAGWRRNQTSVGTSPDIAATGTIGLPSNEENPVVGQVEQDVLTTEQYMRSLFPANFEEFFKDQGKTVMFDEKMNIFISVDGKTGEKRAIFPHASAGDPEEDLAFAESVFDAEKSCLSDATVNSFNPQGAQRAVCMFTNKQHPIYGSLSFHPDLLKKKSEVLAYIAKYIYRGDQKKINNTSFNLLINTSAADARDYTPRPFEDVDSDDEIETLYEEWGLTGLGLPADPMIRLDVIPGQNGQADTVIFNAFPNYGDILATVPEERWPLLPHTLPAKLLYLALKLEGDRTAGETIPNDPGLDVLGNEIKKCKEDKNATIGGTAKPDFQTNLEQY